MLDTRPKVLSEEPQENLLGSESDGNSKGLVDHRHDGTQNYDGRLNPLVKSDNGESVEAALGGKKFDKNNAARDSGSWTDENSHDDESSDKPNETINERTFSTKLNLPTTLKREKSLTDTIERKKKKVKFSDEEGDENLIVQTRVYDEVNPIEAPICDRDLMKSSLLSGKLKCLLKNKRKRQELEKTGSCTSEQCSEKDDRRHDVRREGSEIENLVLETKRGKLDQEHDGETGESCINFKLDTKHGEIDQEHVKETKESSLKQCVIATDLEERTEGTTETSCQENELEVTSLPANGNSLEEYIGLNTNPFPVSKLPEENYDVTNPMNIDVNEQYEYHFTYIDESIDENDVLASYDTSNNEKSIAIIDPKANSIADKEQANADPKLDEQIVPTENEEEVPSSSSMKREGTFILEESPPLKSRKMSTSFENLTQPKDPSSTENPLEPEEKDCSKGQQDMRSQKHVSFNGKTVKTEPKDHASSVRGAVELKVDSLASKRRARVNVEKRINSSCDEASDNELPTTDRQKKSFRHSAKKTLINAWKYAVKSQSPVEGSRSPERADADFQVSRCLSTRDAEVISSSFDVRSDDGYDSLEIKSGEPSSIETNVDLSRGTITKTKKNRVTNHSNANNSDDINIKSHKIKPFKSTRKASDEARKKETEPVVMRVKPVKRDGTFSARWSRQFDGERSRLEAEVARLTVEKQRLSDTVLEVRQWAEAEEAARKALRREHLQRVRQLKEQENSKRELALTDLRNRLEEEHNSAVANQKIAFQKNSEVQLQRQEREHTEHVRKIKNEAKHEMERIRADMKKDIKGCSKCEAASREQERQADDLAAAREARKKLEESLQTAQEAERQHGSQLRRLHTEHDVILQSLRRDTRHQHGKAMEELKCKDRNIALLEKQLVNLQNQLAAPPHSRARSEEKRAESRKTLSRSVSSPAQPKNIKQRHDQLKSEDTKDTCTMDGPGGRGEMERLREEVQVQRRTIRQLSLRLPRDCYKEDQPLSLGNIPSVSMDNVFDALHRPPRHRYDAQSHEMLSVINDLREENSNLRSELHDARDQADLLEFRVLELTEGSDRFSEPDDGEVQCDDKVRDTQRSNSHSDDLISLPLSLDSGLDVASDSQKSRMSPTTSPAGGSPASPSNTPSDALSLHDTNTQNMKSTTLIEAINFDGDKPGELMQVARNLQEALLSNPQALQDAVFEAIQKMRDVNSRINNMESKITTLSDENNDLTSALSALSEAHETRTEVSGTESEIVNRKTPSLHSDLSDSESDSSSTDANKSSSAKSARIENVASFQESGIFEGSCDLQHSATQTENASLKENSDDYQAQEIATLKGEKDKLKEEKLNLQESYNQLCEETKSSEKCSRCSESAEVYRGESRVLREQLRVSEITRKSLYDDKCELEEAENDARLMVQRLDSQLTAAREMELLLSASLSQEQEISRELHMKVKELQALEKERLARQLLDRENLSLLSFGDRAVTLVLDKDYYASQLHFVKHSLILLQVFRHFQVHNTRSSIPSVSGLDTVDDNVNSLKFEDVDDLNLDDQFGTIHSAKIVESPELTDCAIDEALMEITDDVLIDISDDSIGSSQQLLNSSQQLLDTSVDKNFSSSLMSLDDIISPHSKFPDFLVPGLVDTESQTDPVVFSDSSEESNVSFGDETNTVSTVTAARPHMVAKGTMTVEKDLLSQRENFYLEQIETLQQEKMALRKEQDQDRSESLERYRTVEAALEEVQVQLSESEQHRALLQCQLEEHNEKREAFSLELHKRMEEMRGDLARSSDLHEMEKKALRRDFDARLSEVSEERHRHAQRCSELQLQLSALRKELEVVGSAIVADMTGYEGEPRPVPTTPEREDPSTVPSAGELLDKIRALIKSENSLRTKISELEKKESAYHQTLQEADQIMLSHVTSYTQRIEELERDNKQQLARIEQLQKSEDRIKSSLQNGSRSEQEAKVNELLQQIIDIEKSDMELKNKLWSLEKSENELKIKVAEGQKVQESLRSELRDQEEIVQKMRGLEAENHAITQQLQAAHESVRRVFDMQQSEDFLKGRIEELESSESSLKETLQQQGSGYVARERRYKEKITGLEEDISSLRQQLESATEKGREMRESEVSLRRNLDTTRHQLEDMQRDLNTSSASDSQTRHEVTKLRSQLKLGNNQLGELESICCGLRERLAASEQLRETLDKTLDEHKRRHENDLLQLNLQASQRESRLEETEGQLCELTQLHAANELDLLASSAVAPVIRAAHALTAQLNLCGACSSRQGQAVGQLKSQLTTLTELINGTADQDVTVDDTDEEEERAESVNVTTISIGGTDCSSALDQQSSADSASIASETLSSTSDVKGAGTEGNRPGSPVPIPAPRRKRKMKREDTLRGSLRARKKGSTTILDELEEKVRELEESTSRKEEELRIADHETTELNSRLTAAHQLALLKDAEVTDVRRSLSDLQQQLLLTMQRHETEKRDMECHYEAASVSLTLRVQKLLSQVQHLAERGGVKDRIIETLVMQIRAILRTTNMDVVIRQIKQIKEKMQLETKRKQLRLEMGLGSDEDEEQGDSEELTDFDVESVCLLLDRPQEIGEEIES